MGAWESKTVTFTTPAPRETDMQSAPWPVPSSRPAVAPIAFTVTSDMIVTCDDPEFAFTSMLGVFFSANITLAGTTSTVYCNIEISVNGTVRNYRPGVGGSSLTAANRFSATTGHPDVKAGDLVEVRFWAENSAISTMEIDWWAWRCLPGRLLQPPVGDGRWLYHNVRSLASPTPMAMSTVLANKPGVVLVNSASDVLPDTNVLRSRAGYPSTYELMAPPTYLLRASYWDTDLNTWGATSSTRVHEPLVSGVLAFDRLLIPTPPPYV